jgi:interleukin-1 receptor-associated kinase 1
VQAINYNNLTIRVVDAGVKENDCSSLPDFSLTYATNARLVIPEGNILFLLQQIQDSIISDFHIHGFNTKGQGGNGFPNTSLSRYRR